MRTWSRRRAPRGVQRICCSLTMRSLAMTSAGADDFWGVAWLLDSLREMDARDQAATLTDRLPGAEFSIYSASKETARISSGSAERLTAAQPSHGPGKIWTDMAGLDRAPVAEEDDSGTRAVKQAPWLSVGRGARAGHAALWDHNSSH